MALKIFLGGKLVDEADAKISVFDHGLLYGDGVFEGIRVYDGKVFLHQQHIDRLFESAKAIRLTIPLTPAEVIAAVEQTVMLLHASRLALAHPLTGQPLVFDSPPPF